MSSTAKFQRVREEAKNLMIDVYSGLFYTRDSLAEAIKVLESDGKHVWTPNPYGPSPGSCDRTTHICKVCRRSEFDV